MAATYDGRLLARAGDRNVQEVETVKSKIERLAWHLTDEDVVDLFQHVVQYRWVAF
jgi:hypothetical protein